MMMSAMKLIRLVGCISLAGRVPGHGEVVRHLSGVLFVILEGDPRLITLLKLRGLPGAAITAKQE